MTNFAEARQERVVPDIEWDDLLKSLHEGRCVLLLGPQLLPGLRLFDELERWLKDPANGYRLPTEAEWQYAATNAGRDAFEYSGSDNLDEVGWYGYNSGSRTRPVMGKTPNGLDLYDLSGNVWEWCWDWHDEYPKGEQTNYRGPESGSSRVLRGGSWNNNNNNCSVRRRNNNNPGNRNNYCALNLTQFCFLLILSQICASKSIFMNAISISTSIVQTPDSMGNQPHIAGRRIRVKDIVLWFESLGMSADEIADAYDLTLADVYSALAFYHLHQKSLREQWEREQSQVSILKKSIPSKINRQQMHGEG